MRSSVSSIPMSILDSGQEQPERVICVQLCLPNGIDLGGGQGSRI